MTPTLHTLRRSGHRPAAKTTRRPRPSRKRALTLVEMVISMVIVSVMLVAALNTVGASKLGQNNTHDHQQANLLAHALMAEILNQPYADSSILNKIKLKILVAGVTVDEPLGPEVGENVSGYRDAFDDVDDYNGLSESPPREKNGTALPGLTGWRRNVTVVYTKNSDPNLSVFADEGSKRITVQVLHNDIPVAEQVALRTLGPPLTELCCLPDGSGTVMQTTQCIALGGTPQASGSNALNSSCPTGPKLEAQWKFNENTGTTATDSENGLVATLISGATWATGQTGSALSLDATDDYANVPHDARLSLTSQFTITAWIRKTSVSGFDNIVVKGNLVSSATNFHLRTNGDEISFGFANGSYKYITTTSANLLRNNWYHIAGTFDAATGTLAIYVNGVLSRSGTVIGAPLANSDSVTIGKTSLGDYFDGRIDDLRIYDEVLTVEQLADVMSSEDP
ncbi:MAG: LamG-like jellyroll fold domain-containing protein [Planctomycetota bacterium]